MCAAVSGSVIIDVLANAYPLPIDIRLTDGSILVLAAGKANVETSVDRDLYHFFMKFQFSS